MALSLKTFRIAAILAALLVAGCAAEPEPRPETPNNAGAPTFVSLNPCLDAILVEVAEPEQILALSHYSHDPASSSISPGIAQEFRATGGTVEEILALDPDIVLASTFISPATRNALDQMGVRVETFDSPVSLAKSVEQVQRLADLTKSEGKVEGLLHEMQLEMWPPPIPPGPDGSTYKPVPDPSALLWQPGEIVPGKQTLIAEFLAESGFTSHSDALGLAQADRISLEQVLANPPDVLLVAGDSPGQYHPSLRVLEEDVMIRRFPPYYLYCAGPTIPWVRAYLYDLRWEFEERER